MKKRITIFTLVVAFSGFDAYGYFRFLVKHSQTSTPPNCNAWVGWSPLWTGWSLVNHHVGDGYNSPQDLSKPGSCAESFFPMQAIKCDEGNCDYPRFGSRSVWLINKANLNTANVSADNASKIDTIRNNRISRCVVCYGKFPIIVKHSYKNTPPSCPTGWSSMWEGFSLVGANQDKNREAGQDLGDTGSCLEHFVPNPVFPCENDKCRYTEGASFNAWLVNLDTISDTGLRSNANATDLATNTNRIGRCRVCVRNSAP